MTGLAGGFAADAHRRWGDFVGRRLVALRGRRWMVLHMPSWVGRAPWWRRRLPSRFPQALARHPPCERSCKPTRRSSVSRSFAPGAATRGRGRVRGWRPRPARWADGHAGPFATPAAVQAVDFVVLAWPTADAVAPPRNDQEAVRQPGGPHQRPTSVNLAGSTRSAGGFGVARAKTPRTDVSKAHRPRMLPWLRIRMSPPLHRPSSHIDIARGLPT